MGRTDAVARHPALGHNTRRAIYKLICAYGPLSCRDVADMMGCKSPDIIGHVTVLHRARLVRDAGPSPTGRRYQERKDEAPEPKRATVMSKKLSNVLELAAVTGHSDLKTLRTYYAPKPGGLAAKLG